MNQRKYGDDKYRFYNNIPSCDIFKIFNALEEPFYGQRIKKYLTCADPKKFFIRSEFADRQHDYDISNKGDGCKCKIHFPKIGLTFTRITQEKEEKEYDYFGYKQRVTISFNVFATNDEWFKYEILEREVSQKQLEKELGYKIKIKE